MAETVPRRLSVVVTSYESPALLRSCLEALASQPEVAEVVVSDCSAVDPAVDLAAVFPGVTFLHTNEKRRIPELRWAALPHLGGGLFGALEARCPPSADWARRMVDEHAKHPQAAVIGGPVAPAPDSGAFEHGLYFCEYGAFAPPVRNGPAPALTGANLCYKREALDEGRDLIDAGSWETFLHERWRRQGREMRLCEASVTFHNTMTRGAALRQRFHYGRGYAADRAVQQLGGRRFLYALLAPVLPLVLTARSARQAFTKGRGGAFLRALGWVVALQTAWSLGEAVGYLAGADPEPRIF